MGIVRHCTMANRQPGGRSGGRRAVCGAGNPLGAGRRGRDKQPQYTAGRPVFSGRSSVVYRQAAAASGDSDQWSGPQPPPAGVPLCAAVASLRAGRAALGHAQALDVGRRALGRAAVDPTVRCLCLPAAEGAYPRLVFQEQQLAELLGDSGRGVGPTRYTGRVGPPVAAPVPVAVG